VATQPAGASPVRLSVFTKPWRSVGQAELVTKIKGFGIEGVELPVRPGYQVEPATAESGLPALASALREAGLEIFSVASELDEPIFAACAKAEVPIIRVMAGIDRGEYLSSERRIRDALHAAVPFAREYGVRIGVQQHYGDFVSNAVGLVRLVEPFDPAHVGLIWDAAHDALAGMEPESALDLVWDRLYMVNLKNAYYERVNGPEAEAAEWRRHFTTGPHGMASWARVAAELQRRRYEGVVCLTAEYTAEAEVDRLLAVDVAYARACLAGAPHG
jgi:sugar phosphate isomerase/epimerase